MSSRHRYCTLLWIAFRISAMLYKLSQESTLPNPDITNTLYGKIIPVLRSLLLCGSIQSNINHVNLETTVQGASWYAERETRILPMLFSVIQLLYFRPCYTALWKFLRPLKSLISSPCFPLQSPGIDFFCFSLQIISWSFPLVQRPEYVSGWQQFLPDMQTSCSWQPYCRLKRPFDCFFLLSVFNPPNKDMIRFSSLFNSLL
jgi:hypothetical protein